MKIHEIDYNSQRDNFSFDGKLPGYVQCFSTCAWMFSSFYVSAINAKDNVGLKHYVDNVEVTIGKPGIGERVKKKFNWITGRTSYWWLTQKYGIEDLLWRNGVVGNIEFIDINAKCGLDTVKTLLLKGPVILGTKKMGGLSGGHIILVSGYTAGGFYVNDPYGNALKKYKDHDGDSILYPYDFLRRYTGKHIRCIYWKV